MRYDEGYGRQGGWETRMPDGGRGWDQGYPDPRRGGDPADRPWVGGYREGYQGGSGGYSLRTSGPLYGSYGASQEGGPERERGYRRPRGQEGRGRQGGGYFVRARAGYGGDYGGQARGGYGQGFGGGYDRGMRSGPPARGGGYDQPMRGGGGGYDLPFRNEGRPRPLHDTWTSNWTRGF